MPSRQDQLQSYQFAQQRVVAAIVAHDPDPRRSPLRRAGTTVLVGLVVAALVVGAVAAYALIRGGGQVDARNPGVVFLERGTGARFVYLKADDRLHPVLNFTSGLLIADAATPALKEASAESLAAVPLGDPLGIPDAPDSLPAADALLPNQWTVCSFSSKSVLAVGTAASGGTVLPVPRAGAPAEELRGLLVNDLADRTWLVHANQRFLLPPERVQQIRTRFGYTATPLAVAAAWLNAVPAGPDLDPPDLDDLGDASSVLPGVDIGLLLRVRGEGGTPDQWGVVLDDGVADLTAVQAALLQTGADPVRVQEISISGYANLPRSRTDLVEQSVSAGLPATVPALVNGPESVCLTYDGDIDIRVGASVPSGVPVTNDPAVPGTVQADEVTVPRGKGALVVSTASPSAPAESGTVSVITDTGRRFPLAGREVLTRLGYGGVTPVGVPGQLVSLLPAGPSLDPAAARRAA
ncbi:type VII secretion protein EccB [Symbioplanes lichenis]|uniref:type VII secretion protein EccB n=1 Tax=Symbioplanes lichenis TaxID=1629072 RepID=UPI002738FC5E|nr:type VII secretion protein EccB [Actinoplanes lichenis]